MENGHYFEGTMKIRTLSKKSQKEPKGLSNTFIRGSLLYYLQKLQNMENEHYFEGTNENSNFVQKKSKGALKKPSGIRLSGVPSYIIYKNSKNMED